MSEFINQLSDGQIVMAVVLLAVTVTWLVMFLIDRRNERRDMVLRNLRRNVGPHDETGAKR